MALRIVKAQEPIKVEQIVMVIYGAPGIGKSTLGFTADNPLALDFDRGAYRAANRGDTVQVESWQEVTEITPADLTPYNTIVVDTAGRALDFLTEDIIRRNPKQGRGGALTLQGYGALKSEFTAWLKSLRILGKDVVLIAHGSEEKKGDDILERLDVQGGSKGEIYKVADAMGRMTIVAGQRVLNFSPTEAAFGKNPGCLPALTVPDVATDPHYLAGVMQTIKDKLNAMTTEQKKRQSEIADWLATFDGAKTAEDFNELVGNVKAVDASISGIVKGALLKMATEAGFTFDKKSGGFTEARA
jgi:hypothetical protein